MKLISMTEEVWKPVVGYEKYYEISNYGNCRSLSRKIEYKSDSKKRKGLWKGKLLKPIKTEYGYLKYQFCINGVCKRFFAHRVVAIAFLDNKKNKKCVNHIDANRENNMVDNLEWATDSENVYHSYNHGNRDKKFYGICCVKKEIKLKTLISLKDFVLKYHPTREQIVNYAKFIDTPLKLENFIVCDEEGDILEEPTNYEKRLLNMMTEYNDEVYTYYQAKVKVLFEGIELVRFIEKENPCYVVSNGENEVTFHIGLYNFSKGVKFAKTIEDLIHIQPILTESAIKQIGL